MNTPTLNQHNPGPLPAKALPVVRVPFIFYWEEQVEGLVMMTAAFEYEGLKFGESWLKGTTPREGVLNKTHLIGIMKDTLAALVLYGKRILDSKGNIDVKKYKEEEAGRFFKDPMWGKHLAAFSQVCKVKEITKDQAIKIGLLK